MGIIRLKYDLHIHSCLSPCASDDMTPGNIIGMASICGLEAVAVSDHNSCLNLPAAVRHAEDMGILLVPAMELTTAEEVHVLCLFPGMREALDFSARVRETLPVIPGSARTFGRQLILDGDDSLTGEEDRMLSMASGIGVYDIAGIMGEYRGIAIPAHVDRPSFSLYANLGFYDPSMGFSCAEISRHCPDRAAFLGSHPELGEMNIVTNSDAHDLEAIPGEDRYIDIGERTAPALIAALGK